MKRFIPLIAGNWKMNGNIASATLLAKTLAKGAAGLRADLVVCPPAPLLIPVAKTIGKSAIALGGQDCHTMAEGAFTGDTSAELLKALGCKYVIVGHSERRNYHQESDALIAKKAEAAHRAGLITILCIGETEAERAQKKTLKVLASQLKHALPKSATSKNCVIAYEPVWAIGTGKVASLKDIEEAHRFIAKKLAHLKGMRILYGGSVKASNAKDILKIPCVHGVLVGGASLNAKEFLAIAKAAK